MNVLFIASMSVVAADPPQSRKLFIDALGLPLEKYEADDYHSSEKHPRQQALRHLLRPVAARRGTCLTARGGARAAPPCA